MARILLVEPEYKNKYPPIGLMKIATYHRNRNDIVEFYKGNAPYTYIKLFDRIYITSLFTFHYDILIECIKHYQNFIKDKNIFVGGIAASLLSTEIKKETEIENIICGQLINSKSIGYDDNVNIDTLPLDYDILDDISYKYPAGDNYFIYTTRGCKRNCNFCAVRILEPTFETTNNIVNQVTRIDQLYGSKRNLLLMDNNVLYSNKLNEIINDIKILGYNGNKEYITPNPFIIQMNKIKRRKKYKVNFTKQLEELLIFLSEFSLKIKKYDKALYHYNELISEIIFSKNDIWSKLKKQENDIAEFIEKYRVKTKMIRYVDFNQGIDARLINEDNIKELASIPIRPLRLAYDNINETQIFINATNLALKNKIKYFSNYMLYNYEDKPEDLWIRLHNAIKLYNKTNNKIDAFSFPMKYSPINRIDRSFIGYRWNRKYLAAVNIIINVTKGVVVKEIDFFYEAFGTNIKEYKIILNMPNEFIRFRKYFTNNGLITLWKKMYIDLSSKEKKQLLNILCDENLNITGNKKEYSSIIKRILFLYKINKSQFDRKEINVKKVMRRISEI